jgi:MarR family transcriptional regulator, organic hydroperoxide resistance regulator
MVDIQETISFRLTKVCRGQRNLTATMLNSFGLYPGQDLILMQLWKEEGITQTRLAARVGIDVSTLTKSLQRLERYGLVRRTQDAEDTRVVRVYLTEKGRTLEGAISTEWVNIEAKTLAGLTNDERNFLSGVLRRIESNLRS